MSISVSVEKSITISLHIPPSMYEQVYASRVDILDELICLADGLDYDDPDDLIYSSVGISEAIIYMDVEDPETIPADEQITEVVEQVTGLRFKHEG